MSEQAKEKKRRPRRKKSVAGSVIKGVLAAIGRLFVTMMMVGIITGCIVASVMTVYILRYIGAEEEIDLDSVRLGYTSIIYATDSSTGEPYELQRLYNTDGNRIWIDYEKINENTKKAMVAIEDKRFWDHEGVDWKRTFGAFVNMFIPGASRGGGSTIHQQLIKNLTEDDEYRIDRKVREIFRAINLGQRYSHEQVLEAYLNVVPFGNNTNGIQAAANAYFGKDAKDLTLAESAAIVGITQKPTAYNPFFYPERNKNRREYVLEVMYEEEFITEKEYQDALKQNLVFKREEHYEQIYATQNYFVDHVIEAVIEDFMELRGWTYAEAEQRLYKDGYSIYTTVDMDLQNYLEDFYSDVQHFIDAAPVVNKEYPQSASVILEPDGKIVAMAGGIGEKTGSRTFNRATMAKRHPGSSIKPLGVYALAFEYDQVNWSTIIDDTPINLASPGQAAKPYPVNYYGQYLGPITVDYAIRRSVNTIPVKLAQILTPRAVFDFLHNDLQMYSLIESATIGGAQFSDVDIGPMALGSMTEGVTPLEMAGGYQIFINGGYFTKPYAYTKVEDANGKVILETDTSGNRVISEETSVVLNKLLQRVTTAEWGTGRTANLNNMPTGGKTGTSSDDVDQWFIGITPYYVCQIWLGYDKKEADNYYGEIKYYNYSPPLLYKAIMQPVHEDLEYKAFIESPNVQSMQYCTITGDLASAGCTSTAPGWYNVNSPRLKRCNGNHTVKTEDDEESGTTTSDSSTTTSPTTTGQGSVHVDWDEKDT